MKAILTFALASAVLMLTACRSDPIQFHTLTPAQPAGHTNGVFAEIQIESVSVPPQVDRPQIVIRQGKSGMAILETEWWGASLVDELRSALAEQLSVAKPTDKSSLRVDVQRFDSIPGQYALIEAKWRLRLHGSDLSLVCRSTLKTPSGASIQELVIAQQNNIKRLADLILRAAGGGSNGCPSA